MNIFNKYGIKEVADVIFYSITRIGSEEFYTPVLFFDTLKVATIDKSVETVNAKGGKGNSKILSWSFDKDVKLKLEDALFSQMSLDTFMNGRVMAKMSDWTSAIAKLNVANKYGQLNYSTKAYPSPRLTKEEEEIIFRCAQKVGYNSYDKDISFYEDIANYKYEGKYLYDTESQDSEGDQFVAFNRKYLMDNYYKRTQPEPRIRDLAKYLDYNEDKYGGVQIFLSGGTSLQDERKQALAFNRWYNDVNSTGFFPGKRELILTYYEKDQEQYQHNVIGEEDEKKIQLEFSIEKTIYGPRCHHAEISIIEEYQNTVLDIITEHEEGSRVIYIGNEFFLSHILYFIFPHYLEDAIGDLCWCDQQNNFYLAMPQRIIDEIANEITEFNQIGQFENDLYEAQYIDRFEKCVVNNRDGMKIDIEKQLTNIKKLYNNEKENYTVFYDAKTMLPFIQDTILKEKDYSQKSIYCSDNEIKTNNEYDLQKIKDRIKNNFISCRSYMDVSDKDIIINKIIEYGDNKSFIFFNIDKRDYFTLKYGTIYYKWSRTIDENNNEDTFIGTDLSIDADTFPGEYMIVGETYIREQKTGKDQRYQFLLNRAAISGTTKIQLQASGGPSTFSIDVDVLQPLLKDKAMIELRQYNVEKDNIEGGYKIVPQTKHHSYTQIMKEYEEIVVDNNEIY